MLDFEGSVYKCFKEIFEHENNVFLDQMEKMAHVH
jgi:hypothetical protein